ncbi:hypothetical protein J3Q64DRAFT_1823798 [Phycomyces blakesleeanus]|uniref:Uncharacterized protein n=1 Tax=Phycomyces blakesleeanus TaxID=4837 RepID=A0ABR3ASJ5_PHYBL
MRDRVEELVNKITTEDKTNELKNKRLNLSLRNNDIKMKKVPGLNLTELLPFVATTESKHTIQQLGKNLIDSNRLDADFMCLFASQNLQFVHSYFFGACGAKEDNLSTHSVQNTNNRKGSLNVHGELREYVGRQKEKLQTFGQSGISQALNNNQEASAEHKFIVQDLNSTEGQQDFLEEGTLDDDVPERRLNSVKSIIKHLVFSNVTSVYLEDIKHESLDTPTAEQSSALCGMNTTIEWGTDSTTRHRFLIANRHGKLTAFGTVIHQIKLTLYEGICPFGVLCHRKVNCIARNLDVQYRQELLVYHGTLT